MGNTLARIVSVLLRLPLLEFVPRGYLTRASGYLQVALGALVLLQVVVHATLTGEVPELPVLETAIAAVLIGNGAQGLGLRRAEEGKE